MIEDPPLLTINAGFSRPAPDMLASFTQANTGVIVDCLGGGGAIPLKSVNHASYRFVGSVLTCGCSPADNLAVFAALKIAQAGDVLVVSTGGYKRTAVIGDMVLAMAANCGVTALVTDGYVRDLDGICEVGIPCFAAGVTPNSPARVGPGTVGLPVVIDGISISSSDIMIGDRDGVVVVPQAEIEHVLERLPHVLKAEAELELAVKSGLKLPEFVGEVLDSDQVKFV